MSKTNSDAMTEFDRELIQEFVLECTEMLDNVEPEMISTSRINKDLANKIFRPVHSMKGVAGSFGFNTITKVAHASETFLSLFREENFESNSDEHLGLFLKAFDLLRQLLTQVSALGNDKGFENNALDLIDRFENCTKSIVESAFANDSSETVAPIVHPVAVPIATSVIAPVDATMRVTVACEDRASQNEQNEQKNKQQNESSIPKIEISDDLVNAFKMEALEYFDTIETSMMSLIKNLADFDSLHVAFRYMHSFKGNCGIFELHDLEVLGHRIETIFEKILEKKLESKASTYETILKVLDVIREGVQSFTGKNNTSISNMPLYIDLLDMLDDCDKNKIEATSNSEAVFKDNKVNEKTNSIINIQEESLHNLDSGLEIKNVKDRDSGKDVANSINSISGAQVSGVQTSGTTNINTTSFNGPLSGASSGNANNSLKQYDIRVSTAKLDKLNNLVGELVTAKTMLLETINVLDREANESLDKSLHFLSKTINDLQDVAVEIRMIPISGIFNKMIRIVHDLSRKSSKKVNISFFGEDTEVDKTLLEKISDPLVHMIRNSVDHGIEKETERVRIGKNPVGNITLGAKQESGEVWIIVQDDGGGLDKEKILKKALSQGLLDSKNQLALTDDDIYKLIFKAGFSTAEQVTDISGRGVGMDVVQQNIIEMKGRIEISTEKNKGTIFTIKIPLTLAIIDGMLIRSGKIKYTLPIESIQEIVKLDETNSSSMFATQQLVKIRGDLVPVIDLAELHAYHTEYGQNSTITNDGILLVISANDTTIALKIDELLGQQQAVVKPLANYFENVRGISGCSIQGDGEVSLILDIGNLINIAHERYVENESRT